MVVKTKVVPMAAVRQAALLAVVFLLAGCAAPQLDHSLHLPLAVHGPGQLAPPDVVIGVEPFVDRRPQAHGSDNQKWKGLIPGVLWLEIGTEMPEIYTAFSPFSSKPMDYSAALAVAEILNAARAGQEVFFIPHNNHGRLDYRLEGVLHRSLVRETSYFYGSFMYAWLTRVIGLPYVSFEFELDVELRLRSMKTDEIVWRSRLTGSSSDKYYNVYSLVKGKEGKDVIAWNFRNILTPAVVGAIPSLRQALP
jgi:hypothetical protein